MCVIKKRREIDLLVRVLGVIESPLSAASLLLAVRIELRLA